MTRARLNYSNMYQNLGSITSIVILTYLCGFFKIFTTDNVNTVRTICEWVLLPGVMFYVIAKSQISVTEIEFWYPFFVSFCTCTALYSLCAILCLLLPLKDRKGTFITATFALTYKNYLYYGYALIQNETWGTQFQYIPIVMSLFNFVVNRPLHTYLGHRLTVLMNKSFYRTDHIANSEKRLFSDVEDAQQQSLPVDATTGNPISLPSKEMNGPKIKNNELDQMSSYDDTDESFEEIVRVQQPWYKKTTPFHRFLFSLFNPYNLFAIIGIIYNACIKKVDCSKTVGNSYYPQYFVPTWLEFPTSSLANGVAATGLFVTGNFLYEHSLLGGPWPYIIVFVICHYVVIPLISAGFCKALSVPDEISQIIVFMQSLPCGITGYVMALNTKHGMHAASYTWYWTHLLAFPALAIWIAIFNEMGLFANYDHPAPNKLLAYCTS